MKFHSASLKLVQNSCSNENVILLLLICQHCQFIVQLCHDEFKYFVCNKGILLNDEDVETSQRFPFLYKKVERIGP